jgi:3-oxoacyl-[acyl-carrier-protein] synthase II
VPPILPQNPRKVVVTGIGLWTALGGDRESTWQAVRTARNGARLLESDDARSTDRYAGYPLWEDGREPGLDERVLSIVERTAAEALADAGLSSRRSPADQSTSFDSHRVATLIGLSKGCVRNLGRLARATDDPVERTALRADHRFWESLCWPNAGARLVASLHDLRGPCLAPVAACATGLVAVLQGADLIRRGVCDVALAGSADASLEPMLLGAFRRMGVLARPGDDPGRSVRPWERARSGFLVGEGGAVVVLEHEGSARARGALPYAEVAGGALGSDAYHPTTMNPDPSGLARLIERALADASVPAANVDHVNVHGTATRMSDPIECRAIRLALGSAAGAAACSANKSQIGHLLGAAGAVELALTCLTIRDGFVPPTLNLDHPDADCDLDGTPHVGRARPIRAALKLSIGFGGHLAAAVLRRPEAPRRGTRGDDHG